MTLRVVLGEAQNVLISRVSHWGYLTMPRRYIFAKKEIQSGLSSNREKMGFFSPRKSSSEKCFIV